MRLKNSRSLNSTLLLCLIVIAFLTSIVMACGESSQIQKQLDDNSRKWSSKGIKNYQYTFNWSCYCTPDYTKPVIISVREGAIDNVKYADSSVAIDQSNYERYKTVEGLFEMIQNAIKQKAYKIEVTYDPESGYPSSAFIDYSAGIADEEKGFTAKHLNVFEGK
jgi:hypothetical protein